MQPTNKQKRLAQTIDAFVKTIEKQGGSDTELLAASFPEQTTRFKKLMDSTTNNQMDALCEMYPGFYRFAKLLETIAQGLQDGTIKAPSVN